MWDRWDTWPSSFSENRRAKRSPYKNIKIKIGNPFADSPFYYNGKKPRRRVRVKQVLAARPAHVRLRDEMAFLGKNIERNYVYLKYRFAKETQIRNWQATQLEAD